MNENEVWKPYPEFSFIEGSSLGRVRTLDRMVLSGRGRRPRLIKGHILKQYHNKYDYLFVSFSVDDRTVNRTVHRIIASCFIHNPDNLPQVNHKNCIRDDDRLTNLEWCDASYNMRYREKYGVSMAEALRRPLYAVNLETLKVSRFQSRIEAGRVLGVYQTSISQVIRGKLNHTGGYWFTEDGDRATKITKSELHDITTGKTSKSPVLAINLVTLEISHFPSRIEAGRQLSIDQSSVAKVIRGKLKTAGGYWFTEANNTAVEITRRKFGNIVADQVEKLMNKKEMQLA